MNTFIRHFQRKLLAGLLVVVPVAATLWILNWIFGLVDGILAPAIWKSVYFLAEANILPDLPGVECQPGRTPECTGWRGVGLVTTLGLIYLAGVLSTNFLGLRVVSTMDRVFTRVPVFGGIYSALKQLIQSISNTKSGSFKRVVLVEFPVAGNWTVGFVTGELADDAGREYLSVFVATAPNPTTGFAMVIRKERAVATPMTVEEGFSFLMSAGVVRPARLTYDPLPGMQDPGTPAKANQPKPEDLREANR